MSPAPDEAFELVRFRGQLVRVRVGASPAEIAAAAEAREARSAASAAVAAALPASFDMADPRPLLLIDVDGVVCPIADGLPDPAAAGLVAEVVGETPVWFPDGIAGRLKRLGASFQLVWCTAWQTRAAQFIAPRLGLPPLPVIAFDEVGGSSGHWKWPAIEAFVGSHPFAWIDDELDEQDLDLARARASSSLLVRIEPTAGLDDEHVRQLEAFARSLTAPAAADDPQASPASSGPPSP